MPTFQKILCPVDFSDISDRALACAGDLAASLGAELLLVHAFDEPATATYADVQNPADPALRSQLDAVVVPTAGVKQVERVLHVGPPGEVICWLAEQRGCDLIILGTHGRTGLTHLLLGSVAEYVVRHARCPVLTVTAPKAHPAPLAEPMYLPPKAPRFM